MASISKHQSGWRVAYYVTTPQKKYHRSKYSQNKSEATKLKKQLESLEQATKTGLVHVRQIEEWVGRGWISGEQAVAAFPAFRDVAVQELAEIDLDAVLAAYEDYAISNSKARDATRKAHRNHMSMARGIIAWLRDEHPQLALEEADIWRWLDGMEGAGKSEWTLHHHLTKLRLLLDQAVKLGMIRENVARMVTVGQPKTMKTRRILSNEEAQHLLQVCHSYDKQINGCLPMIIYLGLYAGLRNEEMAWCSWDWLDERRRILTVQATTSPTGEKWQPKDVEARRMDVKDALVEYWRAERRRQKAVGLPGPFVLVAGHKKKPQYMGRPIGEWGMRSAFAAMIKEEDMDPRITIYSLRHTYATSALRSGVDIATVQRRLGHSDIRTTMGYLQELEPEQRPMDNLPY